MTPNTWLWIELEKRLGKSEADALYQEWLAEMRRYHRLRLKSKLAPDAPRTAGGRKPRSNAQIGDRSICSQCNYEIRYSGEHWKHSDSNPRHIATPVTIDGVAQILPPGAHGFPSETR